MNPLPVIVAADIVRLEPPVFDRLSASVLLLPTVRLPKFMELGVTLTVPIVAAPLSGTVTDGFDAFDAMTRLALLVPAPVGA